LRQLNSPHAPRSSSGKFITIYPADLESFRELIVECDRSTQGFKAPFILSDKPFARGSNAYYRYGAFKREVTWNLDGMAVYSLKNEAGESAADIRGVSSRQPDWTIDPLGTGAPQSELQPAQVKQDAILLNGRFSVTHAIRHANKGGVYLAMDRLSGNKVVIKEARPHVATDYLERDATHRLAREAENLHAMHSLGITPAVIDLFQESGHHFLAIEWIPGKTLRSFVAEHRKTSTAPLAKPTLGSLAVKIAHLLDRCHKAGFIVRDFTPNNIMVQPNGHMLLIDIEMACKIGDPMPIGIGDGTPGYTSPAQLARQTPTLEDDYFSLGGILFFLSTLHDPLFPEDEPPARSNEARALSYHSLFTEEWRLSSIWSELVVHCLDSSPSNRFSPRQVIQCLQKRRHPRTKPRPRYPLLPAIDDSEIGKAVADAGGLAAAAIRHIESKLDLAASERPVPTTCLGEASHPCNVQHGAAGIGLALIAHARAQSTSSTLETVRSLSQWMLEYLERHPEAPAGLYFGTAGTAWCLLSAADLLEDRELRKASLVLASSLPLEPPLSDITHGAAGIGLAWLHFFHQTGDTSFLDRALSLAEYINSTFCTPESETLSWNRAAPGTTTGNQGGVFYGFAHGIAGVAYFFLMLYLSLRKTSRSATPFLLVAQDAARALLDVAIKKGASLYWSHGPASSVSWPHWCNGSSGVGTFLLRLGVTTEDRGLIRAARLASRAVVIERWNSGVSQCHGLSGNGEYLLDLFELTGDSRFLREALHLAKLVGLYKVLRPEGVTFPDDSGLPTGFDFSIGTAGVAAFLSRLANATPRILMLDYLLPQNTIPRRVRQSLSPSQSQCQAL
jgi:tRNA A-37 threonylcarbamoyl transferase component Bud32